MKDQEDLQEEFRFLAKELNVEVVFGELDRDHMTVVGSPPTDLATLCRGDEGYIIVAKPFMSPTNIEAALHELAHTQTDDEEKTYELAAVWALRFPVKVSTEVAEMAKEALG